ncbi:hypothetical protein J6590_042454 [Homalodisca vitripennis]|nr:hypothetical protein J6590_042454 [Homalodisca vitripennis]
MCIDSTNSKVCTICKQDTTLIINYTLQRPIENDNRHSRNNWSHGIKEGTGEIYCTLPQPPSEIKHTPTTPQTIIVELLDTASPCLSKSSEEATGHCLYHATHNHLREHWTLPHHAPQTIIVKNYWTLLTVSDNHREATGCLSHLR